MLSYWRAHVRGSVRFADGIATLKARGRTVFLEIGPRPVLSGMTARIWDVPTLASLHADKDDREQLAEATGLLWAHGVEADWKQLYPHGRKVDLPRYAWQSERYWLEPVEATAADAYADWTYELKWRQAPPAPQDGRWKVIGDDDLARELGGSDDPTDVVYVARGTALEAASLHTGE